MCVFEIKRKRLKDTIFTIHSPGSFSLICCFLVLNHRYWNKQLTRSANSEADFVSLIPKYFVLTTVKYEGNKSKGARSIEL